MLLAKKNANIADNRNPVNAPRMVQEPGLIGVERENQSLSGRIRVPVTASGTRMIDAMNKPIKNGFLNVGFSTVTLFFSVMVFLDIFSLGFPLDNGIRLTYVIPNTQQVLKQSWEDSNLRRWLQRPAC